MSHAQQVPKRKRRRKAVPMLGAAGLSFSLASGASAAIVGPAADLSTRDTEPAREITLAEEEISDLSLATFYVFDKESVGALRPGLRLAAGGSCAGCGGCGGGCGCWTGTYYTSSVFGNDAGQPYYSSKPVRKYTHTLKPAPKNP